MKFTIFCPYIFLLGVIVGCSDKNDPSGNDENPPAGGDVILSISTEINSRTAKTAFVDGDRMNLFVKEYNTISSNNLLEGNIIASFTESKWNIQPEIKLNENISGFVYAFYPFDENITSASYVSIDANEQIDYLYSGKGVLVSLKNPEAKLNMSHAMSAIAVNIIKGDNYKGSGILHSITVSGDGFKVKGNLNIETGVITPETDGAIIVETEKEIVGNGWNSDLPQTFTIPFESDGKKTVMTFSIDDQSYQVILPSIKIERGMKYIFKLGLSDNNITLFSDKTEVVPLQKEDDEIGMESNVKTIVYDFIGEKALLPDISGENMVAGFVNWGDNSTLEIYKSQNSHIYKETEDVYTIKIENWNADKVTFNNLIGISKIDLSNFK